MFEFIKNILFSVYTDDSTLIPKNTSVVVARVPAAVPQKRSWDRHEANAYVSSKNDRTVGKVTDLTRLEGSEADKIRAMMAQSTQDYDPST